MTGWLFRHKFLFGCVFALLLLGLGCGRTPQTGQPGGDAPAVVEVWHHLQGAEADALQEEVRRIMESQPEIVKLKYVPAENFVTYSYQAGAGGGGPHIFIASQDILWRLYELGLLSPAVYVDQAAYPAAAAVFRFEGNTCASPWLTDVPLLYYRLDLAEAPESVDDLFSNKGGISLDAANTAALSAWWTGLGGQALEGGNPVLNSPNNLAFLYQLLTWQTANSLRVAPGALDAFVRGETGFVIAGAGQAQYLTGQGVVWGSMQLGDLTDGQGFPLLGPTWGIANSAVQTSEVMVPAIQSVEKALLTLEVEVAVGEGRHLLPANMAYGQLSAALPQADAALRKAWVLEGNAVERKLFPLLDVAWREALAGNVTAEEALAAAQGEAVTALTAP